MARSMSTASCMRRGRPWSIMAVHGCPYGASREEHVIHQHHTHILDAEGDFGLAHGHVGGLGLDVVPVEGDVYRTDGNLDTSISSSSKASSRARWMPPVRIPTSATSVIPLLRSRISWAIRVSAV